MAGIKVLPLGVLFLYLLPREVVSSITCEGCAGHDVLDTWRAKNDGRPVLWITSRSKKREKVDMGARTQNFQDPAETSNNRRAERISAAKLEVKRLNNEMTAGLLLKPDGEPLQESASSASEKENEPGSNGAATKTNMSSSGGQKPKKKLRYRNKNRLYGAIRKDDPAPRSKVRTFRRLGS